jgi:hypothetical protein
LAALAIVFVVAEELRRDPLPVLPKRKQERKRGKRGKRDAASAKGVSLSVFYFQLKHSFFSLTFRLPIGNITC